MKRSFYTLSWEGYWILDADNQWYPAGHEALKNGGYGCTLTTHNRSLAITAFRKMHGKCSLTHWYYDKSSGKRCCCNITKRRFW